MVEYTKITREQYFSELESRMGQLEKELKNGPDPRITLKELFTSVGLETANLLESMEEPKLKPVYLKVKGVDALFGSKSFEVMPQIRYDHVKDGRELYSKRE